MAVVGCCECVPITAVPRSGGGVAVGRYPVGTWLFVGLGCRCGVSCML